MADKPVFSLDLETAAFDKFKAEFDDYHSKLGATVAVWKQAAAAINAAKTEVQGINAAMRSARDAGAAANENMRDRVGPRPSRPQEPRADPAIPQGLKQLNDTMKTAASGMKQVSTTMLRQIGSYGGGAAGSAMGGIEGMIASFGKGAVVASVVALAAAAVTAPLLAAFAAAPQVAGLRRQAMGLGGLDLGTIRAAQASGSWMNDPMEGIRAAVTAQRDATSKSATAYRQAFPGKGEYDAEMAKGPGERQFDFLDRVVKEINKQPEELQDKRANQLRGDVSLETIRSWQAMSTKEREEKRGVFADVQKRTSMSAGDAKQWQFFYDKLRASGEILENSIIKKLTPLIGPLGDFATHLADFIDDFKVPPELKEYFDTVKTTIGPAFDSLKGVMVELTPLFGAMLTLMKDVVPLIGPPLKILVDLLGFAVSGLTTVLQGIHALVESFKTPEAKKAAVGYSAAFAGMEVQPLGAPEYDPGKTTDDRGTVASRAADRKAVREIQKKRIKDAREAAREAARASSVAKGGFFRRSSYDPDADKPTAGAVPVSGSAWPAGVSAADFGKPAGAYQAGTLGGVQAKQTDEPVLGESKKTNELLTSIKDSLEKAQVAGGGVGGAGGGGAGAGGPGAGAGAGGGMAGAGGAPEAPGGGGEAPGGPGGALAGAGAAFGRRRRAGGGAGAGAGAGGAPGGSGAGYGGSGKGLAGKPKQAAATVADVFRKAGASEEGIAGMMANIKDESGFKGGVEEKGGTGIGLWQFSGTKAGSEKDKFLAYTRAKGLDWRDPKVQAEYQVKNLKENYKGVWAKMQTHAPAGEQAETFLTGYERPKGTDRHGHAVSSFALQRAQSYRRGVGKVESYTGGAAPEGGKGAAAAAGGDAAAATRAGKLGMKGVDPRLGEIVGAAAGDLGYDVRAFSGKEGRHDPRSFHGKGMATDFAIYDKEGHKIADRGADPTGMYSRLARQAYARQQQLHPELTGKFAWGGAFGTKLGGGGQQDLMHFDIGGERGRYSNQFGRKALEARYQPAAFKDADKQAVAAAAPPRRPPPPPPPPPGHPSGHQMPEGSGSKHPLHMGNWQLGSRTHVQLQNKTGSDVHLSASTMAG